MKCQKCGAEMFSGHLYCDICGAEYQIVPDFEPEIESSIASSMADISETLDENSVKKDKRPFTKTKKFKVPSFSTIFFLVLVSSVFMFGIYFKYTHSTAYQSQKAITAIHEQDYYTAAQIYENIRKKNTDDAYWYAKEAEIKLMLGEKEKAYHLALLGIELDKNADIAYDFILSYLESEGSYEKMNEYLKKCEYEEIKEKYWEYLCEVPSLNYESGNYDQSIELMFDEGFQGTIYYTINGDIPDSKSSKYDKPIKLGNGVHILKAIYENEYGLFSEPVVFEYKITSSIPMSPIVNLPSGNYTNAEMVEIEVEEGTKVYYTTDLSLPTEDSTEYTAPIPMPLGESNFNFIAISEKGISSEITQRTFMLNIKTYISVEEAEALLMQKLISTGHILNQNGSVQGRYGVFRYFYKFPISETEINYYVFEEHYLENQINNPLNHFYAVDVLHGNIYMLISDNSGKFTRVEI